MSARFRLGRGLAGRRSWATFLALALLVGSSAAQATSGTILYFKARLGAQVGVTTSGDGSAFFTYDTGSGAFGWTINYRNLSGAITGAEIRLGCRSGRCPAAPNSAPPLVMSLPTSASPLSGSAIISSSDASDLLAGFWDVDLQTAANSTAAGEIAGSISAMDTMSYSATTGWPAASSAYIQGTVQLDPSTLGMSWNVSYGAPLLHIVTGTGFHGPGAGTENAPLTMAAGSGPGSATLTAAQFAEVVNGFWYYQVDDINGPYRAYVLARYPVLGNASTRVHVSTGSNVAIAGFVIGGLQSKSVAIVATGPSLASAGIANPLANPKITLLRVPDNIVVATNDDWQTSLEGSFYRDAGFAPSNALEAALLVDLAPGAYTAIVEGSDGGSGVALVSVYEVNHPEIPLINLSTRGQVLTNESVMIGGFVIQGDGPEKVVVRGLGPSLSAFGIAGALANPTLQLVRMSDGATIAANDDWGTAANASEITASGFAPSDPRESAILMTLDPGAYTAILSGAGGTTGTGIVEVYKAP